FLTVIAVFPDILLFQANIQMRVAIFFGGTGMLITVGVMLDTMRQIETHLLQRHYDGFLKKGRIKSRGNTKSHDTGLAGATDMSNVGQLYIWLLVIFSIGIIAWVLQLSQN
ncbi:MAG: preprotein translocase subunit SecY, partial [Opitutales bacterium]|nr:preprotein translocase subunit SecY [Opitutales bacterium]